MPCKGMAYCNRVQRLLFFFSFLIFFIFHSIKVDGQPQRATLVTLFHCSQRNQKLMPGDAGPKTNALRPLLDRYETPLLCWKNWKRYQRQTVRLFLASLEKGCEFHQRAPLQSLFLFFFYMQQKKMCHCSVFVKFFVLFIIRIDAYANFKLIHMRCKQSFIANKVTENIKSDFDVGGGRGAGGAGGGGLKWSLCLAANSCQLFKFPKRLPTMKIYRGETAQVRRR